MSLVCSSCGRVVETLPIHCGYSITINKETNQWECNMKNCGTISFNDFLCETCCTNRNIMNITKSIERLTKVNEEFNDELTPYNRKIIQTTLNDSNFNYWVTLGEGEFKCGKGEMEGANVIVSCPQEIMNQILLGNSDAFSEFLKGNLKLEGDLQYAVVYFDLIKLALEIGSEIGGVPLE
ncbi:MAG: SCP2 sterol-binding domain-containing protein [Candidatus Thorarchaeota archaeon]